jgi:FAD:protein FMN transferase
MRKKLMSRRQMLRIVAAAGIAGLTLEIGRDHGPAALSETRLVIGTIVNLTVVSKDATAGRAAITSCLDRMSFLEALLSRFNPGSDLARLNRDGHLESASPALLEVLEQARQISDLSGGAFDVTILPVLSLYQDRLSVGLGLPSEDEVLQARRLVDYRGISVAGTRVSLARPGMGITLDGLAKGYIIDAAVATLRGHGFANVLVEAGGDLLAQGQDSRQLPWEIGIQAPRREQGIVMASFGVTDVAVATSGDYMQPFAPDYSEHHILDPRTGHSAPELSSATIDAPTAVLADALATAVMVMGPRRGIELVETIPGCECYLVTKGLNVLRSRGFGA